MKIADPKIESDLLKTNFQTGEQEADSKYLNFIFTKYSAVNHRHMAIEPGESEQCKKIGFTI